MILEKINGSADVKRLTEDQLKPLASEIRHFLIEHVAETGGHLAASLGVVELTLALHRVFDVEYDRLVWDVGHQAYVHKLLTGRKEGFQTLRQFGGMSGFPKAEESITDAFNTGHSSTSISAAVGFAAAAKLKGEERAAVAVIGDGSLTGGMAFEALNHAGTMKIPLVVVLNDNGMSISKNVGGLSKNLRKIRNTRKYFEFKSNVKSTLERMPAVGDALYGLVHRTKQRMKPLVVQNVLFEDLGFHYMGPVDGHHIEDLEFLLRQAKEMKEPVVVHIRTKKGKGYGPAERDPERFHGIARFDAQTGKPLNQKKTPDWSEVFGKTLCRLAEKNLRILAITAAMPTGTGLQYFQERFPQRFYNVGIAEQHGVTFAAGLSKAGMIPCFAVYSSFLQRGYDQLLHDVALQKLHTVFCLDRSGPVGADGETHQGVFDLSYLSHLPGFTILSPSSGTELQRMMEYAFEECRGPVAIRYPRGDVRELPVKAPVQSVTKSRLLREGDDVLIAAVGTTVYDALAVAEQLEMHGVHTAVLDVGIVKPMDQDSLLNHSSDKKLVATLEDNVVTGGFGEQAAALLGRNVLCLAYPDVPIVQGTVPELKEKYGLSSKQIAERILERM